MAKQNKLIAAPAKVARTTAVVVSATLLSLLMVVVSPTSAGAQDDIVIIDMALQGSIQSGPPRGGVSTSDLLEYRLTIINSSDDVALPARSVVLKVFVETNAVGGQAAEMEVVRFSAPELAPIGTCGNGRTQQLLCTNRRALLPGEDISLVVRHRHPEAVAGRLTFSAELSPNGTRYEEPENGQSNNGFSGTPYVFASPPTTTTTTELVTTTTTEPTTTTESTTTSTSETPTTDTTASSTTSTVAITSSTVTDTTDPSTSSTTEPSTSSSTTSTTEPTTTTSATTSTTEATTSTASVTTTTAPTTTELSTTSVEPGSQDSPGASLVAPGAGSVAGANAEETLVEDGELVLAPTVSENDDGGPPFLWIATAAAVLALLGGVGLAIYSVLDRDPPLVDIRDWDQS